MKPALALLVTPAVRVCVAVSVRAGGEAHRQRPGAVRGHRGRSDGGGAVVEGDRLAGDAGAVDGTVAAPNETEPTEAEEIAGGSGWV
jgi:hypothetical protein